MIRARFDQFVTSFLSTLHVLLPMLEIVSFNSAT